MHPDARPAWCVAAPVCKMTFFLAVKLPATAVRLAEELQTRALALPLADSARAVTVDLETKGHVTLHFLGEVARDTLDPMRGRVGQAVRKQALRRPPRLWFRRALGCFPNRIVVVHAPVRADKALYGLQRVVADAATGSETNGAKEGRCRRRERPFRAHVTLARIHGMEPEERKEAAGNMREVSEKMRLDEGGDVMFACEEVVLLESKKDAEGETVYEEVWSVPVCDATKD